MPNAAGRFVTVNPVTIGGDEIEGGPASLTVDSSADVIADWLGPGAPAVGKDVLVESTANRWVAWSSGTASTCVPCDPCCIPKRNLTVTWTNGQSGGGATGLIWDGATTWASPRGSSGIFGYEFACKAGKVVFTVYRFAWPDLTNPVAVYNSDDCLHLDPTSTCSPLVMTYRADDPGQTAMPQFGVPYRPPVTYCPGLASYGFLTFIVTR